MLFAILPGSLRKDSLNKKLGREVARLLSDLKHESTFLDLKEFSIPVYDGDLEDVEGIPSGVSDLDKKIRGTQALIVVTPEYNGSIPGVLKNTIDWLSRVENNCMAGRHILILAATPGALGGIRSLWHTRVPFEARSAHVFPDMFGLGRADSAFDDSGKLKDPKTVENIKKLLSSFISFVSRANG